MERYTLLFMCLFVSAYNFFPSEIFCLWFFSVSALLGMERYFSMLFLSLFKFFVFMFKVLYCLALFGLLSVLLATWIDGTVLFKTVFLYPIFFLHSSYLIVCPISLALCRRKTTFFLLALYMSSLHTFNYIILNLYSILV